MAMTHAGAITYRIVHCISASICFLTLYGDLTVGAGPCTNYTDIGYEYRSVNYTNPISEPFRCDKSVVHEPGRWYRFEQYTGEMMPESCPPIGSCGTQSPIWMNGTHPTVVGMEVEAIACTHIYDCCYKANPMKALLCDEGGGPYYVYQLPVVVECPEGYCAGDMAPCSLSEVWDYDKDKCVEKLTTTADMSTPILSSSTTPATDQPTDQSRVTGTIPPMQDKGEQLSPLAIAGVCILCAFIGAAVTLLLVKYACKNKPEPSPPPYENSDVNFVKHEDRK